jgi:outer membrane murein-binding lipoprotein Lpp
MHEGTKQLGALIDHPVTRLSIGAIKALVGAVVVMAGFVVADYASDMQTTLDEVGDTVKTLSVQLAETARRVDQLERDAAASRASWEAYRSLYVQDRHAYEERRKKREASERDAED